MALPKFLAFALVILAGLGWTAPGAAAPTSISSTPLSTGSSTEVKPNLMFVMDDSGSMDWEFMPDWANDGFCRSAGASGTGSSTSSGGWGRSCCHSSTSTSSSGSSACYANADRRGHPPFLASDFNGVAYNPAVRYRPPTNADGSSAVSMSSTHTGGWTVVPSDAYGVQSSSAYTSVNVNLISNYPDLEWCTSSDHSDCLRNGNYILPGTVNGKAYTVFKTSFGSGSGNMVVGEPNAPTLVTRNFGPHYYRIIPGEWCSSANLRDCQSAPSASFPIPAPLRWCNSDTNARALTPAANSCQAVRTSVYTNARYPTKVAGGGTNAVAAVPASAARATFIVSVSGCANNANGRASFSAIRVNGVNLLAGNTNADHRANNIASNIRSAINAGGSGFTASGSNASVVITAPVSAGDIKHAVTLTRADGNACAVSTNPSPPAFTDYKPEVPAIPAVPAGFPGSFERVDIVPSRTSYPKNPGRTDCAGATCTYAEEMTNFANWFAYYRTRMQTMKSGASRAFAAVDERFRVGYYTLNNAAGSDFLNFRTFEGTDKAAWFSKMRAARPSGGTPLLTALAQVGRLYSGKLSGNLRGSPVADPMQYSCQQNFTLLSTDGYWNETGTPRQIDGVTAVGDQDSDLPRPMKDGNGSSNTLADVAAYYYRTDLRTSELGNCTGSGGGNVCENNVPTSGTDTATHQHMTTFTLGLGASGFMQFQPDYRTATSGDFFSVLNGSTVNLAGGVCTWQTSGECQWPVPANNAQTGIDDLWHAAVNGRGSYFSASDPDTLYTGLTSALAELEKKLGAAAAATTSNPNVSAGDNFVFISNYTSVEWSGELLGKQINLTTGAVEDNATDWSARNLLDANTSRNILMFDSAASNRLRSFQWSSLTSTERAWFQTPHISSGSAGLSQFCSVGSTCLSAASQAAAAGEPLVDFLRGDRSNEGTDVDISKYFRARTHLLGDIVNSEAVYVRQPQYRYNDAGYNAYKLANASRRAMVYVGANDGMLHAFDANTGQELWAYVPSMVLPKLYALADKSYATRHQYYVDSTPVQGDAYINGEWRTLLVGGLGAGGRGYYALDITDPDNPRGLWEFTHDNLGLSFGRPELSKLEDGTWAVMVASGYNNIAPGHGRGTLFVLNAATGALIRSIDTGAGSTTTPSGLAHIRAWADDAAYDNTARRIYGGDNLGNVWRLDINDNVGEPGYEAHALATLRGPGGNVQPVTSRPELGLVAGHPVVYVGTGRYLGLPDLVDSSQQSIYAVKDQLSAASWGNPRSAANNFVQQELTAATCPAGSTACTAGEVVRTGSSNTVNLATNSGWFVDLPVTAERSTNDPQLALGTLVVTTNVVNASACTAGGTSYINFFDYRTGAPISTASGVVSAFLGNALATRPTVIRLPSGKIVSVTRLFDDSTVVRQVPVPPNIGATRRLSWRELATEQ